MKRILHVFNEIRYSGAEVMLYNAIMEDMGGKCTNFACGTSPKLGDFSGVLTSVGCKVNHIENKNVIIFSASLLRFIFVNRIDIIHIHTERSFLLYGLLGTLAGKRTIRTIHSMVGSWTWIFRLKRKLSISFLKTMGVQFVSIGQDLRENELMHFENDTILINNWYDSKSFNTNNYYLNRRRKRIELNIKDSEIVLVSIGNCNSNKNHQIIIKALHKIDKLGIMNFRYIHIGEEENTRSEYMLAKEMGVSEKVFFAGKMGNFTDILHASDIFIMPSFQEGVGISAIEAAASGLPILVSDIPGLRELYEEVDIIRKFDPNDVDSLVSAILDIPFHGKINSLQSDKYMPKVGIRKYLELYGEKKCL